VGRWARDGRDVLFREHHDAGFVGRQIEVDLVRAGAVTLPVNGSNQAASSPVTRNVAWLWTGWLLVLAR